MNKNLYRGKSIDDDTWKYGSHYYSAHEDSHFIINRESWRKDTGIMAVEIDKNTLGQFTGELDKNKTEIFENDKIKCLGRELTVVFKKGMFIMEMGNGDFFQFSDMSNKMLEIMGNTDDA